MSHQITKVDLIPNGELSVCNVSQFDNGRVLPFEILENKEAYNIPNDIRVELHCRKADGNIVTLPSENITDNIVTFLSTTQLTACYGKNVCEIALYGPDDYLIGSGNFILDVEKSPTLGGITSNSEIHNLESQIEEITTEIVGENYYNKTEVDGLLALKANAADVYTKSQVDSALALKANAADVYTKSQVDTALSAKADADTTTAALATKADKSDTYTKEQVDAMIDNIFPTLTASGAIVSFTTALTKPLVSVTADAGATEITACGINLWSEQWEVGNIDGTGVNSPATDRIRSKGYIKVEDFTSLYLVIPTPIVVHKYAEDKSYLGNNYISASGVYNVASNVAYIRFRTDTSYGDEYNNNISINCVSTDTTYHAYNGHTVPVADATTLTTQSGVNNVYADAGNVTVKYKYMSM